MGHGERRIPKKQQSSWAFLQHLLSDGPPVWQPGSSQSVVSDDLENPLKSKTDIRRILTNVHSRRKSNVFVITLWWLPLLANRQNVLDPVLKRRGSRQRCLEGGLLDVWTSCPFTPRSPNKGQGPPCSHVLGPSFRWARMQGQPCLTPQPHTPSTGSLRMHVSDVSSVMTVSLAIACDLEIYSFPTPGHMLRKHASIVCVNGQNYRWKCPIALANRGPQKMHTEAHDCHGRWKGIECESSNFVFFPLLLLDLWR